MDRALPGGSWGTGVVWCGAGAGAVRRAGRGCRWREWKLGLKRLCALTAGLSINLHDPHTIFLALLASLTVLAATSLAAHLIPGLPSHTLGAQWRRS